MMETTPSFLKPFSLIKHSTKILINSNSTYNNINTNFIKFCRKDSNYYLRSCSIQCVTNSRKWSIIELKNDEEEERKNQVIETCISWNGILGLLLLVLTTTFETESALAASGGRIGGSSFSSSSSSSTSSSSSSSSSLSSWDSSDSYTWSRSRPDNVTYHTSTTYAYAPPLRVWRNFDVGLYIYWSMIVMIVCWFVSAMVEDTLQNRTSVIKLQVCLLGTARSLQTDLEQLAEVADTSNSEGLNYILKEATLSLLRHPDFCIFGYSSIDLKHSPKDGEKLFNRFSIEERGKFDEETLSNVNNIKRKTGTRRQSESGSTNEYIVMTILVAAAGSQDLPIISSSADLKEALHKLGSISSKQTLAVEVLWTPQEENDTLSEQELLVKYPLLRSLH